MIWIQNSHFCEIVVSDFSLQTGAWWCAYSGQLTIDKNGKICQIELDISAVMERVSEGERPIMSCDNWYGGQYSKYDLIICKSVSPFQLFVTCLYILQWNALSCSQKTFQ